MLSGQLEGQKWRRELLDSEEQKRGEGAAGLRGAEAGEGAAGLRGAEVGEEAAGVRGAWGGCDQIFWGNREGRGLRTW